MSEYGVLRYSRVHPNCRGLSPPRRSPGHLNRTFFPDYRSPVTPVLQLSDVRFSWPNSLEAPAVLDGLSLSIQPGEQLLLRGGSGSGKSTMLSVIAGLLTPSAGIVEVAGRDLYSLAQGKRDAFRGTHIGMIFQTFQLLAGFSAAENVMAALMFSSVSRSEHRSRATKLLHDLGITRPDAEVGALSVGQQQRVAVARAIACNPVLVLADEPTASLDPDNALAAVQLIRQACRGSGAALLVTSHDPALRGTFERELHISRGKLQDEAPVASAPARAHTFGAKENA